MITYNAIIVKIGGKILEKLENIESTITQFKHLINKNIIQRVIIIPGGGSNVNFIRELDKKLSIGDDLAHWMSIYAMNLNGIKINERFSDIKCINDYHQLLKSNEPFSIFLPFDYLKFSDKLPHSWDITSDSIALYLAYKLKLNECYLIKDVDGIFNDKKQIISNIRAQEYIDFKKAKMLANIGNLREIKKSKPIDNYLPSLINKYEVECIILNGSKGKSRILNYFNGSQSKEKVYTKISFN